jgi:hypothetical protein
MSRNGQSKLDPKSTPLYPGFKVIRTEKRILNGREQLIDICLPDGLVERANQQGDKRFLHIPWELYVTMVRATKSTELALLQLIYRRTLMNERRTNKTVKLPHAELAELGINPRTANDALLRLQKAGLIRLQSEGRGHKTSITLLLK